MERVIFVTGNQEKINIAQEALKGTGIILEPKKINCIEIQDDNNEVVANFSAKYASNTLQDTVIKTDSGLFIVALNGFPGVYSEFVERKLEATDILKLMKGKTDREAYYKEVLAYCEYEKEPITFTTITKGKIAEEVSGTLGWSFDKIFILDGDNATMAHYSDEERAKKYSHDNWDKLASFLRDKADEIEK